VRLQKRRYQRPDKARRVGVPLNRFGRVTTGSFSPIACAASQLCRSRTSYLSANRMNIGADASTVART
jgi:hypothetical protein